MKSIWNWIVRRDWAAFGAATANALVAEYQVDLHKPPLIVAFSAVVAFGWAVFGFIGRKA